MADRTSHACRRFQAGGQRGAKMYQFEAPAARALGRYRLELDTRFRSGRGEDASATELNIFRPACGDPKTRPSLESP